MALNLNILLTRSLSAAVFVIILLGSILWCYTTFAVLFLVVAILGLKEYFNIAEKLGAKPYKMLGYFSAFLIYILFCNGFLIQEESLFELLEFFKPLIVLVPVCIFLMMIFDKSEKPLANGFYTLSGLIYVVLPFILLNQMVSVTDDSNTTEYNPQLILGIIFLIWANDTFAYLGGSLFGKNKMIERVSPGKTWEGTIFGVIVAFGISFGFSHFLIIQNEWLWPVLGIVVPIVATIGDLVESLIKRQAGIKDSGQLMPGHGGALDRFDSLIFVSPVVYAITQLL